MIGQTNLHLIHYFYTSLLLHATFLSLDTVLLCTMYSVSLTLGSFCKTTSVKPVPQPYNRNLLNTALGPGNLTLMYPSIIQAASHKHSFLAPFQADWPIQVSSKSVLWKKSFCREPFHYITFIHVHFLASLTLAGLSRIDETSRQSTVTNYTIENC